MTYRPPDDPGQPTYTDPAMSSSDPDPKPRTYTDPARRSGWSVGSAIGALILLVLIAAGIAYTMNKSSTNSANGPSVTQSAPSTTGQGGPAGPPTGTAR